MTRPALMVSRLRKMARLDAKRAPPAWLRQLLETEFFEPCPRHPSSASRATTTRTAGCNFFCTRCTGHALCSACLCDHEGHQLVQIRRLSGHCVVKVAEVEHLLDVSMVQTYRINGVDAVFLNRRPMSGHGRPGGASQCEECERGLQDATSRFCSIGCKAQGIADGVDFNMSFAVTPKNVSLGDESEDDENEDDGDDDGNDDDDDDDDEDNDDDDGDDDDNDDDDNDDDYGDDDDDNDDDDDGTDDDDDDNDNVSSSRPTIVQKLGTISA